MDGFKAFKYYTALRLHFTEATFNVFVNRGMVRGSRTTFDRRKDRKLFEALAHKYKDKEFIQYVACNFMYGNANVIYDRTLAEENYRTFLKRRQSMTRIFEKDVHTLINEGASYECSGSSVPDVLQYWIAGKICIESLVILDHFDHLVQTMNEATQLSLMFGNDLRLIEKSKGFVKFDRDRVLTIYTNLIGELRGH